ncbi:MAG TPA: hypothetical protein VMD30_14455, partial [Tepidisphaeraceae bacterium]|nr:hypothetical protein [Tepidisphaeraceae bacterium]
AHQWRDIVQLDDIQAAQLIRHDEIDVLVDLAVHSTGNRLGIFAHKPAPVQVTFCGYPGGTGLETIDYRLSDVYLDPAENDAVYAERTLRLPNTFWCYDFEAMSLADLPDVTPPPMAHTHAVTFGCLCHHCKINPAVISRWLAVLDAVPGSRMLLLAMPGSQRRWMVEQMRGRADFEEFRPRSQYMALYSRIDIGLDTFPYNGHTTSLDSFWMGVPVVTLMGQTAVSRAGWSQLNNLGLPELAADTDERFVEIAASLARDPDRLGDLRMSMRQRMKSSPLMDARRFARAIEAAYRRIWQEWAKR